MNLFTLGKIPMYCEGITHRLERRKDRDVKVVDLALKIEPFSPQLAGALDPTDYAFVKRTLFKMGDASPTLDLRAVEFRLPAERQKIRCYASPDTERASICIDQVKVTKLRARSSKDANGWVFYVNVSFGPLDKTELEYVNAFYTEQRFISWEAAQPSLELDEPTPAADPDDSPRTRPTPMFDDDGQELPQGDEAIANAVTPAAAGAEPAPPPPKARAPRTKKAPHTPPRRTH